MIVMNLFYAGAAYPAGAAADRVSQRTLILFGLALLVAADLLLAFALSPLLVFAGAALWGLHMAFTQGLLSKLVADTAPKKTARHGFRYIQPGKRRSPAAGKRDCRFPLEFIRGFGHVPGWCGFCCHSGRRLAGKSKPTGRPRGSELTQRNLVGAKGGTGQLSEKTILEPGRAT